MRLSHGSILFLILILVGAAVTPATGTSARSPSEPQSLPGQLLHFYAAHTNQPPARNLPPDEFLRARANGVRTQTATITVNYSGFSSEAQMAFQFATDIWASKITSAVSIVVNANWTPLSPGVLGSAGPNRFYANFSGAPISDTWYPAAIANKLNGADLDGSQHDINANFNSAFADWYFGMDGNTPSDKYDFVSVVLHELGHGLGFVGSMRVGSICGAGNGCWGSGTSFPFIYDRFAVNGSGQSLIDTNLFESPSPELAAQLTSNDVYFNSPSAAQTNGNTNVQLYAPGTWNQGSSYSHLDDIFNGTPNALMTFSISNGEVQHDPGPVTLCMFRDMGWTVAGCTATPTATPDVTATRTPTASPAASQTPTGTSTSIDTPIPSRTPTTTPTTASLSQNEWAYLPLVLKAP